MDLQHFTQIKNLLKEGKLTEAINTLNIVFFTKRKHYPAFSQHEKEVIALVGRNSDLNEQKRQRIITIEEEEIKINRLRKDLLLFINVLETYFQDLETKEKITIIIPAAAPPRPQLRSMSMAFQSGAMVPVNGKPVIARILSNLMIANPIEIFILSSLTRLS